MKAVILAGGGGTRLWPLSTDKNPKQFHKLTHKSKTLLQETYERVKYLGNENIYIATNKKFLKDIKQQLPQIPKKNIFLEPDLRDTATCIGYAAMRLSIEDPEEVMSIIYADHLIKDHKQFKKKLVIAEQIAKKENTLNIIEVSADYPNPNLGYVKVGKVLKKIKTVPIYEFKNFVEKPDVETAKKYIKSGNYLWNTGIYVWRIDTILEKYKKHHKKTYDKLMKIRDAIGTKKEKEITQNNYAACEKISIDYAIMEKLDPKEVRIIPADFGWNDIGTWESLYDQFIIDKEDNLIINPKNKTATIDSKGCLIRNENPNKVIAAIGLRDIVIVDTPNGLLICDKKRSGDVKKAVQQLKKLT